MCCSNSVYLSSVLMFPTFHAHIFSCNIPSTVTVIYSVVVRKLSIFWIFDKFRELQIYYEFHQIGVASRHFSLNFPAGQDDDLGKRCLQENEGISTKLVIFVDILVWLDQTCGNSWQLPEVILAQGSSHARGRWIRRACRHRRGQMVRGLPSVRRSQDLVVRTFSPAGLQPQRQRPQQATFTTAATGHDDNDRSRSSSERKSAMIAKASCNSTSCGGAIILDRWQRDVCRGCERMSARLNPSRAGASSLGRVSVGLIVRTGHWT